MKILVMMAEGPSRDAFLTPKNLERLNELGEVIMNPNSENYETEELKELLKQADAVITGWGCTRVSGELLDDERHPVIVAHTAGTVAPYVDEGTFEKGVKVVCANEIFAKSVAEGTIAYILAALRDIPYWTNELREGRWRGDTFTNRGLFGKKVGLIGFGAVARNLVPLLRAFETDISVYVEYMTEEECAEIGLKKATVEEIFRTCDIISLHVSLTDETHHMINGKMLSLIKDGALLVNTSRGAVIDEAALTEELGSGRFGAVLDVFEQEPLSADSPLRRMKNVVLMPHMAGPTTDMYEACGAAVIEEIRRAFGGEELRYEVTADAVKHMTAKG